MTPVFVHRLEVRFGDCDAMGHVNNAVYFTYLEQTRFLHARERLGLDWRRPSGPAFILARAECDFKAQATYGDELEIRLAVPEVGRSSFVYEYEIVDVTTSRLVATARSVQVMYGYAAQKPVPIPDDFRARLLSSGT